MQSDLFNKVAVTPANLTDTKGLKHICPDKGYCTKPAQAVVKRGVHLSAIHPSLLTKTENIDRNDPCPCGSGKKFKKCCANSRATLVKEESKRHEGAVERAIGWLMTKHRKAASVAIEDMILDGLSDEEQEALEAHTNKYGKLFISMRQSGY